MPDVIRNYIQQQGLALANLAQYTTRLPSDDGEHQGTSNTIVNLF